MRCQLDNSMIVTSQRIAERQGCAMVPRYDQHATVFVNKHELTKAIRRQYLARLTE